jgi:DNA-binding response OmpR family regulator
MKVLIAEDDPHMRTGVMELLENEGYRVIAAADGEQALEQWRLEKPDFVCLDIMMPKINGYDVCRQIRRADRTIPILFLSAKSEEIDKVLGLELGADDYVMKPFGMKEFVARVRAISRRCFSARGGTPETFEIGGWSVSPDELRARRDDRTVELSLREVQLLRAFAENPGVVLDRDRLFRDCWEGAVYPNSRTLDQHISKLRKKIEDDPKAPRIIRTIHGAGYRHDPW